MMNTILFRVKSNIILKIGCLFLAAGLLMSQVACSSSHTKGTVETVLAHDGHALQSIVVNAESSELTRKAANDLAEYLGRITGGDFEVTEGDGTEGLAVGAFDDFPTLNLDQMFNPNDLTRLDDYLLRSHDKGVYLIGATDLATQHAVWGFLYRLGYRQFFPTDTWEVVPERTDISIAIDDFEQPDYFNRDGPRIVTAGLPADSILWDLWHDRNRITPSIVMVTDHEYPKIIERNKATFDKHPEYLALVDGVRGGGRGDKFCISNAGLRKLVVEDAKQRVKNHPDQLYFSVDPSDGGDWCECDACIEMGSVTDRVVTLANEVAEAINHMGYGERFVGILAYNEHSPPPTIEVHPEVIVSIATSFIKGGYTFAELIEGWHRHARMLGIREYFGTYVWDQGIPRKGNGGSIKYLEEKLPYYYENGARFMDANSTDAWDGYGLGYYISANILWDINLAGHTDELINDFLDKSFGKAREPMQRFFHLVNEDFESPHSNEDLLARMYGNINDALQMTDNPEVMERLKEMVLYTRYVELFLKFKEYGRGPAREKAAQDLYRHSYRMQSRMMSNVGQLFFYLKRSSVGINIPDEANPAPLSVGMKLVDMPPWKSSKLFTDEEIEGFIRHGITSYKKDNMDFTPVTYSEDLIPAAKPLHLRMVPYGDMGGDHSFRYTHKMFTWFAPDHNQLNLEVTGGINYQDRGNIRFMLFSPQEAMVEPVDMNESVQPDGKTDKIILKSPYKGLHTLEWMDGGGRTRIRWPKGYPMTMRASMDDPARLDNNCQVYFYVPKGTETVGGYTTSNDIKFFDGDGSPVMDLHNPGGGEQYNVPGGGRYFNIPVPNGQDGRLWELKCSTGTLRLMTVPPYLARNEKELLLPKEVVDVDKR